MTWDSASSATAAPFRGGSPWHMEQRSKRPVEQSRMRPLPSSHPGHTTGAAQFTKRFRQFLIPTSRP